MILEREKALVELLRGARLSLQICARDTGNEAVRFVAQTEREHIAVKLRDLGYEP